MAQGERDPATAASSSAAVMQVQHQIRANASELQDYFADLYAWEKSISKEDAARKTHPAARRNDVPRARVTSTLDPAGNQPPVKKEKPDAHTYDKGYSKWDKFDVDAALKAVDEDRVYVPPPDVSKTTQPSAVPVSVNKKVKIVEKPLSAIDSHKSRELIEKEEGNVYYKQGDYVAAIKSYTRCLGYNAQNVVVLSNRAMAYIKNREYGKAEEDCNRALRIDAAHVKSYSRRAFARNALGKHRLALLDYEQAARLDQKSKQIQTQLAQTRELMRTAIKRAPKRSISLSVVGSTSSAEPEHANAVEVADENNASQVNALVKAETSKLETPQKIAETVAEKPRSSLAEAVETAPAKASARARRTPEMTLPKLPEKAPTTSYAFTRVWKSLVPKGDAQKKAQLLALRADFLRMIAPANVVALFKNSIESDTLCEIFDVFHNGLQLPHNDQDREFAWEFTQQLAKVPRFDMTVLFLTDSEKADIRWVLTEGFASEDADTVGQLRQVYGV